MKPKKGHPWHKPLKRHAGNARRKPARKTSGAGGASQGLLAAGSRALCANCGRAIERDADGSWADGGLVFCTDQDETHDGVRHAPSPNQGPRLRPSDSRASFEHETQERADRERLDKMGGYW